jgi:hypothetical protein
MQRNGPMTCLWTVWRPGAVCGTDRARVPPERRREPTTRRLGAEAADPKTLSGFRRPRCRSITEIAAALSLACVLVNLSILRRQLLRLVQWPFFSGL